MADYIVDLLLESYQISQVQSGTWPLDRALSSNHEDHLWTEAESRPNPHECQQENPPPGRERSCRNMFYLRQLASKRVLSCRRWPLSRPSEGSDSNSSSFVSDQREAVGGQTVQQPTGCVRQVAREVR